MSQHLRSMVGSVLAALLAGAAAVLPAGGTLQAAEDCIAAPNAPSPPGGHWYYHVDRTLQRKCWFIAEPGRTAHRERSRDESASERPADADRSAKPAAAAVSAGGAVQSVASTVQWPEPLPAAESLGGTPGLDEGEPTTAAGPTGALDQSALASARGEEGDPQIAAPAGRAGAAADPITSMFNRILLLIAGALAAAGILQLTIVRLFAPRRRIRGVRVEAAQRLDRLSQETRPEFSVSHATPCAVVERIDPRVIEDAMQQILREMDRRAA